MVKPFIRTPHTVEVWREGAPVEDRFGNLVPGPGVWEPVKVAGWSRKRVSEGDEDSVLRTVDALEVHFPAGEEPAPSEKIRIPARPSEEWEVDGNADDWNHGPFGFAPGLVKVHCRKVEG